MIKIEDISIVKMYAEQTEVSSAYLGDVLVYEQTGPTPPPVEKRIHVDNACGSFYTNFTPTNNSVIECKMTVNAESSGDGVGIMNESSWFDGLTSFLTGDGYFNILCGNINNPEAFQYTSGANAEPIVVKLSNGMFQFNDNTPITFAQQSLSSSNPMKVGNKFDSNSSNVWTGDVYYIKIYENGVLVRDYEPALVNGVPSLQDTITSHVCTITFSDTSKLSLIGGDNKFIEFKANSASTLGLSKLGSNQTLQYSTDGGSNWSNMTTNTSINLSSGNSVYVRGILSAANTALDYTQFTATGNLTVSGNINTIWNYTAVNLDSVFTIKNYCGYMLFGQCTAITDVSSLTLPSTTLATGCYEYMFYGCTGITTAPVLPATTLASNCYDSMFMDCSNLANAPMLPATTMASNCYRQMFYGCGITSAPVLPATTLASNCYEAMFNGCSSLTTAPTLPATTLAQSCYEGMFVGCTSLTTAPTLPATTLVAYCYQNMFALCSSLSTITCLATDISATGCTTMWVNGVSASGTFYKDTDMSDWTTGANGIPSGWTVSPYGNEILRYGDCINPTAVCRFDTNYVINTNTEIEFKMNIYDTSSPGAWSQGETGCGTSGAWDGGLTSNYSKDRGTFCILCGNYVNDYAHSYTRGNPIVVTMKNTQYTFDGINYAFTSQTLSNQTPVWIGTDYHYWTGDIYYLKIYENGVLVRDYEPALVNGVPSLQDTITSHVCTFTGNTNDLQLISV